MDIEKEKDAENVKILMQSCFPMTMQIVGLEIKLGREGWKLLAEGLKSHHDVVEEVFVDKESLDSARQEDLRYLWDALGPDGRLDVVAEGKRGRNVYEKLPLRKDDGEAAWIRLCQIKDLSKEEWVAQAEEAEDEEDEEVEEQVVEGDIEHI